MKRFLLSVSASCFLLSGAALAQNQGAQQENQPQAQQRQQQTPQAQQGQQQTQPQAQPGQQQQTPQAQQPGQGGASQQAQPGAGQQGQGADADMAASTDLGTLTCEQMLALPAPDAIGMLFWIDGYLAGQQGDPVWDARSFVDMRNQIIELCTEEQGGDQIVLEALQQGQ